MVGSEIDRSHDTCQETAVVWQFGDMRLPFVCRDVPRRFDIALYDISFKKAQIRSAVLPIESQCTAGCLKRDGTQRIHKIRGVKRPAVRDRGEVSKESGDSAGGRSADSSATPRAGESFGRRDRRGPPCHARLQMSITSVRGQYTMTLCKQEIPAGNGTNKIGREPRLIVSSTNPPTAK